MSALSPLLTVTVDAADGVPLGYVVIDSFVHGTSSGGVRLVEDVDLGEIRLLAREMTLKFGFAGLGRGGAKAGVRLGLDAAPSVRRAALERFGRGIRPLIETGAYYPGRDMSCTTEDLQAIYHGAGIALGPIADTSHFTALSVAAGVRAWERHATGRSGPVRMAIQGFGSVASKLVQMLGPPGYSVVALSTARGARYRAEGFAPETLAAAWSRHGPSFPETLSLGEAVSLHDVLCADVDVLVPSARTGAIDLDNVSAIRAAAVVPAANAPFADDAAERLAARGCVCLPGFACNAGGVYGSSLSDRGVRDDAIVRVTDDGFEPVMTALLERSKELGVSPIRLAEAVAEKRSRRMASRRMGRIPRALRTLSRRGLVPKKLDGAVALSRFVRELAGLEQQVREWTP